MCIIFSPHLIAEIIKSLIGEFAYSIIMHTLTMSACQQMPASNTKLKIIIIHCPKEEKYLNLHYVKHVIFIYDNYF